MSDDKIKQLPVKFKSPPGKDAPQLQVVDRYRRGQCNHVSVWVSSDELAGRYEDVTYLIREGETEVECGNCGVRLDPVWVLLQMARSEAGWRHAERRYHEEMQRLSDRQRTMCEHCGKMTRISDTKPKRR